MIKGAKDKFIDLTGQRFGKLTIQLHNRGRGVGHNSECVCLCDCGKTKVVRADNLKSGKTKSCGCIGRYPIHLHRKKKGQVLDGK
jgi:hypothetical protein